MSTITKEFTKEQLVEHLRTRIEHRKGIISSIHIDRGYRDYLNLELLSSEIALASLEAEEPGRNPVLAYADSYRDMAKQGVESIPVWSVITDLERNIAPLFTATPAPANSKPVAWPWSHRKHPSEVTLVRPEDDEKAEAAQRSGWSCQALYAEVPTSTPIKDHQIRELVNELRDIAIEYHGTQQLRERIARTVRAAMLHGADGNSPVIPDGWVACSERMPDADGNYWGWWSECKQQGPVWFTKTDSYSYFQSSEITHWMPLPAAPQQEE